VPDVRLCTISNTIIKTELIGIASALRAKCTHIATVPVLYLRYGNSSNFLSPRRHMSNSEHIVSMVSQADTPIHCCKLVG